MPKRYPKLFSAEQANRLIPTLELIVRDLMVSATFVRNRLGELRATGELVSKSSLQELVERYPELDEPSTKMAQAVEQIEEFGCLLKDIDQGLVDFPFDNGGEVAFLCWQFGEKSIEAWHPVDSGFMGRQPLPGARKTWLN